MKLALLALIGLFATWQGLAGELPAAVVPDCLGVNIHFTRPQPGEMEMIRGGGFRIVRMDFDWNAIEKERGQYDFSSYDVLVKSCQESGIRILFIIDYANPLYDDNRSPDTDEGRAAMARFAREGVKRYKGRGILWEMYNEPNISPFWRPGKPDVENYSKLAIEVGKAIRAEAPDEIYIGPATSGMDLAFLEGCFKAGLLEYWDAVSVHPYRQQIPETVIEDYRKLRLLIAKYAAKGKTIPILSGEWGYSSIWSGMDEQRQAKMLARQWLVNFSQNVRLSIWYDWKNDGLDPKEPEHHFGSVHLDLSSKPAYEAAKELTRELDGFTFNKRLMLKRDEDWMLLFTKGQEIKVAAWTTDKRAHLSPLPGFDAPVELSDTPIYLVAKESEQLRAAVDWERAPLEVIARAPRTVKILGMDCPVSRGKESHVVRLGLDRKALVPVEQETRIVVANPVLLRLRRDPEGPWTAIIENPSGEPFEGVLDWDWGMINTIDGGHPRSGVVKLPAGQTVMEFERVPRVGNHPDTPLVLRDASGIELARQYFPHVKHVQLNTASMQVLASGDEKVASEQSITDTERGVSLSYRFSPGWKFAYLSPANDALAQIDGKPRSLGMFVTGDGSGNILRMRFVDSTGQTFQPDFHGKMDWTDRRYVEFLLDGKSAGYWGGANDGVVHYPIKLDAIILIDNATRQESKGQVTISSPVLHYDRERR